MSNEFLSALQKIGDIGPYFDFEGTSIYHGAEITTFSLVLKTFILLAEITRSNSHFLNENSINWLE